MIQEKIRQLLGKVLTEMQVSVEDISVDVPSDMQYGDYSSNVAFIAAKQMKKNPLALAEEIVAKLQSNKATDFEKVEAVRPGFINFSLSKEQLLKNIQMVISETSQIETTIQKQKFFIEYAHPNTHKEMHIGHMRTLITGEALSRLLESQGHTVFRANYQSDIGPHIAKALYGMERLMKEEGLSFHLIETWKNKDKAHFLGKGYARGSKDYESAKEQIDSINSALYNHDPKVWNLYQKTRQWSLDYYEEFYPRFYTKFDRLFFESEMVECGLQIVRDHIGKIFTEDDGAVIFKGEQYGLHTRVFITKAGNPTYEGKEVCNGFKEHEAFAFDTKIHVVGSEQIGYFQVVFKALELLDPEKFKDKQYHLPMGMVQFTDRKISSRTGDVLTVDWLIDQVKEAASGLFKDNKISPEEKEKVLEQIAIGAIKYSVLKVNNKQDAEFDIQKSVSLDGNSGPYIQYTYARTRSVLRKGKGLRGMGEVFKDYQLNAEEADLARLISHYYEVLRDAATGYAPHLVTTYLFTLAKSFNLFYQKHRILEAKSDQEKQLRIMLVEAVSTVLKNGLGVLGIAAPAKM